MPKIGKIKFRQDGSWVKNTRNNEGSIAELDLQYYTDYDCFFFKASDILEATGKKINTRWGDVPEVFVGIRTKEEACKIMSNIITDEGEEKRFFLIKLDINYNIKKGIENVTPFAKTLLSHGNKDNEHGLVLTVRRIVRVSNKIGNMYYECDRYSDDNPWSFSKWGNSLNVGHQALIEWTPEREEFLNQATHNLNEIAKNIALFFNVEKKDLDFVMNPSKLIELKK